MAAQAFDNTNLKTELCPNTCNVNDFGPDVTYTWDGANEVIITNSTAIPPGDTLKVCRYIVHDQFGNEVRASSVDNAPVTLDISSLDRSKPLNITATVTTALNLVADGISVGITAAGVIGNWDKQQNA